jgi:GNAT superfamily N-acetyltransferase
MLRPMREDEADDVYALSVTTFGALARSEGESPSPAPARDAIRPRHANLVRSDAGGCWVAEEDGRLVGCVQSIVREGIWGLSLLVVHPERQSAGIGRELLDRAYAYGNGARGRIILSSRDPRALRAYARLGLTAQPSLKAKGVPRAMTEPGGVRVGTPEDLPFLDAVSRHVRGAAHGRDMLTFLEVGATILIAEDRGYAVVRGQGGIRQLAAFDEDGARDVLRAALARATGESAVDWLTERQAWAVPVCLDAGLRLSTDSGPVFVGGDVGRFTPYLPSGAFL